MSPNEIDMMLLKRYRQQGDTQAFAQIVDRHQDTVLTTARQLTGCATQAQDVSQETFVRLLRTAHPPQYSLRAWLLRVTQQLSIDRNRSERSRRQREGLCAVPLLQEAKQWDDLAPHLSAAIAQTPQWSQRLLKQHFFQGSSLRQLAAAQSISPATMSRRLQAALDELRRQLRKRGVLVPMALLGTLLLDNVARAATLGPADSPWQSHTIAAAKTQQQIVIASMALTALVAGITAAKTDPPRRAAAALIEQGHEKLIQPGIDSLTHHVEIFVTLYAYRHTPYVYVPGCINGNIDNIAYFEKPDFASGFTTVIITTDHDVLVLRNDKLEQRLLAQTGNTPTQLLLEAKKLSEK